MATPPFLPDEAKPVASDLVSAYPAVEQLFRDIIESWILVEHNTTGYHGQVHFEDQTASPPGGVASYVVTYNDSGVMKMKNGTGGTVEDVLGRSAAGVLTAGNTSLVGNFDLTGTLDVSGVAEFASPVFLQNGTLANCALSWSVDPNTGIYRTGANAFSMVADGASVLDFAAAGITVPLAIVTGSGTLTSSTGISVLMSGISKKRVTLDHDTTLTVSAEVADQMIELWIEQGSTGGTGAWAGVDKWVGGSAPTLSTVTGEIDIIVLASDDDGTTVIGQHAGTAA